MIDIRTLRENPEAVRASQQARGDDPALVDTILAADEKRRASQQAFEDLRAQQKNLSRTVGKASPEERPAILAQAKDMSDQVKALEAESNKAAEEFQAAMMKLANPVLPTVPAGGEDDYEVLREVGTIRDFAAEGFEPKDHLDVAEAIGAVDMERGTKVSGSRFYYLKGIGARLELALLTMAADQAEANGSNVDEHAYPCSPRSYGWHGLLGCSLG